MENKLTLEDWENGRIEAAIIVKRYGEVFLPIFNHIEQKIEELKIKEQALDRIEYILASVDKTQVKGDFL